jgi:hypothetical protein
MLGRNVTKKKKKSSRYLMRFQPNSQKIYVSLKVKVFILGLKPFLHHISTTDFHPVALSLMLLILLFLTE